MASPSATTTSEPLAHVANALAEIQATGWNSRPDNDILAALAGIDQLRNQLDALAGTVALAAQNGAVQRDGARTTAHWIGANTSGSSATVRRDVLNTKWLLDYPTFAHAFATGALSVRHVDALRRAEHPVTRAGLRRDQELLVDIASALTWTDFQKALQYWINAEDPDGQLPREQTNRQHTHMRRRIDGTVTIDASLDALNGTATWNAYQTELQRLRNHDTATGTTRTTSELQTAALVSLLTKGAQRNDGTTTRPLIDIVVGEQLLEQLIETNAGLDTEITPRFDDPDYRCEFIDGTPLHPHHVKALLGIAEMRRIIIGAQDRPRISHKTRNFPQWMRDEGLIASRGQCTESGCDAPFHWLQADHIQPVAKGGPTHPDNEQTLCRPDNHAKSDTWHPPPHHDWPPHDWPPDQPGP